LRRRADASGVPKAEAEAKQRAKEGVKVIDADLDARRLAPLTPGFGPPD